ncbi:MAG: hypothetical protein K8R25_11345 [Methanosarcinales archaeon]|nr:hypothetical protein [Methanosarcinales archaeon]
MDEITRVIKDLFWLLQNVNIAEEDYKVGIGIEERIEGALRRDRAYDSCWGWCLATGILYSNSISSIT